MAAFKQLESDTEHVATFQLLNVIMAGDIKGLNTFAKDHASALSACNITLDDAIVKTRFVSSFPLVEFCMFLSSLPSSAHFTTLSDCYKMMRIIVSNVLGNVALPVFSMPQLVLPINTSNHNDKAHLHFGRVCLPP
eukprot:scaffold112944_cov28-Prasinocladus_malaysianus.AAC.1